MTIVQAQTHLQRTMTTQSNRYLHRITILTAQTENNGHPYSSNRYLHRTLATLTAQTGIYTEQNLQIKHVFTEKSVVKIHSSKWKQEKTMKYHNRMGEGGGMQETAHDSLVSNFDCYSTYFLTMTNTSQHKLQYNTTEIQQNSNTTEQQHNTTEIQQNKITVVLTKASYVFN